MRNRIGYIEIIPMKDVDVDKVINHAIEEFNYLGFPRTRKDCEINIKCLLGTPQNLELKVEVITNVL